VTVKRKPSKTRKRNNVYQGVRGKVVEFAEHAFESGVLYIHVGFKDKTELCWRIGASIVIERSHLADWKTGDLKELRVFVRHTQERKAWNE
jgi:hypothetical protein